MIEIDSLTFGYLDKPLLNHLTLSVKRGEIVSIIGPSGSGKTTLFKLIAGLCTANHGTIRASSLSYMMQEDLLLPWKTVLENVLFAFELKNIPKQSRRACEIQAMQLLQDVGLEGFEHYYPITLSGGMRQRVSLARSLLFQKPLLLLDEPFGAVDIFRRKDLYTLLKKIKEKYSLTILLITHDLRDAIELSHRIYYLDQGRLVEKSKEELLEVLQC